MSCWKRLRLRDWFFEQKTMHPKAPLMPNSRTSGLHYRNPFISLISLIPWAWYEILRYPCNSDKVSLTETKPTFLFFFFFQLYFKPVSLMTALWNFAFFDCRHLYEMETVNILLDESYLGDMAIGENRWNSDVTVFCEQFFYLLSNFTEKCTNLWWNFLQGQHK